MEQCRNLRRRGGTRAIKMVGTEILQRHTCDGKQLRLSRGGGVSPSTHIHSLKSQFQILKNRTASARRDKFRDLASFCDPISPFRDFRLWKHLLEFLMYIFI